MQLILAGATLAEVHCEGSRKAFAFLIRVPVKIVVSFPLIPAFNRYILPITGITILQ